MNVTRYYRIEDGNLVGRSDTQDRRFSKIGRVYRPAAVVYQTPDGIRCPAEFQEAVQTLASWVVGEAGEDKANIAKAFFAAANAQQAHTGRRTG
jgi:hypothetical protein